MPRDLLRFERLFFPGSSTVRFKAIVMFDALFLPVIGKRLAVAS